MVKSNTSYLSMNRTGLYTPIFLFVKKKEKGHLIVAALYQLHSPEHVTQCNIYDKVSNRVGASMHVSITKLKYCIAKKINFRWL